MQNVSELFDFAIQIEENGFRFYQQAQAETNAQEVKILFQYLMEEEATHIRLFKDLQKQADTQLQDSAESIDHFAFLKAFVNNVIFSKNLQAERPVLNTPRAVVTFALARETESILYYEEIKRLFSSAVQASLDRIIQEEIQHYLKLSKLLEKM